MALIFPAETGFVSCFYHVSPKLKLKKKPKKKPKKKETLEYEENFHYIPAIVQ